MFPCQQRHFEIFNFSWILSVIEKQLFFLKKLVLIPNVSRQQWNEKCKFDNFSISHSDKSRYQFSSKEIAFLLIFKVLCARMYIYKVKALLYILQIILIYNLNWRYEKNKFDRKYFKEIFMKRNKYSACFTSKYFNSTEKELSYWNVEIHFFYTNSEIF